MSLLFWAVYVVWLLSEILLNRLLRSGSTDKQNEDKNSLRIIWITIVVSCFAGGYIAGATFFPIYSNPILQYAALGIIVLGILLRLAAVFNLGKFFTVDVTIREGHRLKKNGMYKFIRHPSYAASLLSFIGYGLSLNNWVSLLVIVIPVFLVFIFRINIEEKVLVAQFGEEYRQYQKETKRLIPFIY